MSAQALVRSRLIDWDGIRERLAQSAARLDAVTTISPAQARALMDERARALARRPAAASHQRQIEVLVFNVARERYGVEARLVREIVRLGEVVPVPAAPAPVPGVANLRGEILPLVDLRRALTLPATDAAAFTRIVVLGRTSAEFGVLADAVDELVAVSLDDLREPAFAAGDGTRACIRGVTADALVLLDGDGLLADERLFLGPG